MSLLDCQNSREISDEITVPTSLPMILKQFCKAAIRTQPYDLLKWSSVYFRALAEGEDPPIKLRLEYPPPCTPSGLTFGFIRVLLRQFGDYNKTLETETILRRWDSLCLDRSDFNLIMLIGKFRGKCQVKKFLGIAIGLLASNFFETMIMVCELFTHEPDGGSAMIPVRLFMELYGYLAGLRCDGEEREISEENLKDSIFSTESNSEESNENSRKGQSKNSETDSVSNDSESVKNVDETAKQDWKKEKRLNNGRKKRLSDLKLFTHYPDVPGIGPRVLPEDVASVVVWITECARCQEDMVGPRNLRHFQCPPLNPQQTSNS